MDDDDDEDDSCSERDAEGKPPHVTMRCPPFSATAAEPVRIYM